MRKNITKITAITMAFALMLTGCSLGAKEKDESGTEATEQANIEESQEDVSVTSSENSSASANEASSDQIVVVEDLALRIDPGDPVVFSLELGQVLPSPIVDPAGR